MPAALDVVVKQLMEMAPASFEEGWNCQKCVATHVLEVGEFAFKASPWSSVGNLWITGLISIDPQTKPLRCVQAEGAEASSQGNPKETDHEAFRRATST